MSHKFKPGDKVRCIPGHNLSEYFTKPKPGKIYTVTQVRGDEMILKNKKGQEFGFYTFDFEPVDNALVESFKKPKLNTETYQKISKPTVYKCPYEEYNDKYNLEEP